MSTTKADLAKSVAKATELSIKDSERAVDAFLEALQSAVISEGHLSIMGFGAFKVTDMPEREGRNPATGETVTLAPCRVVRFKVGKGFKDQANASLTAKKKKAPAKEVAAPAKKTVAKAAPAAPVKKKIIKK